jgi:hypothetical protein
MKAWQIITGIAVLGVLLFAGQVAVAAEQPTNGVTEGPSDSPSNIPPEKLGTAPKQPATAPTFVQACLQTEGTCCYRQCVRWRARGSRHCCRCYWLP